MKREIHRSIKETACFNHTLTVFIILSFVVLMNNCAAHTAAKAAASAHVIVDGAIEYQTIEGWGITHFIKWNWEGPTRYPLAERAVMDQIKDMGIDLVQVYDSDMMEKKNDDNDPFNFNWEYYNSQFGSHAVLFERLRDIQNAGLTLAPVPLSLPAWLCGKDKKLITSMPGVYEEIGEYWAAFSIYAKEKYGVNIPYIVIQTEPSWHGCDWTATELNNAVKNVGARLKKEGFSTKILAPDDASAKVTKKMARVLLNDQETKGYISNITFHPYDGTSGMKGPDAPIRAMKDLAEDDSVKKSGLSIWMTEWAYSHAYGGRMRDWVDTLRLGLDFAKMIYNTHVYGNASLYVIWSSQYDWASDVDGNGLMENEGIFGPGVRDGRMSLKKYGHIFKQYSKYIPPGSRRIKAAAAGAPDVFVTAYKDEKTGTLTIETINKGKKAYMMKFRIDNIPGIDSLDIIRTSANENSSDVGRIPAENGSFTHKLEKESVTTFTGSFIKQ